MMKDDFQEDWPTTNFKSLSELQGAVKTAGGVLTVQVSAVRNAFGAQRLGAQVRASISANLKVLGLSHTPQEIPDRQTKAIRIYEEGSLVGRVIEAAMQPGPQEDEVLLMAAEDGALENLMSIVRTRLELASALQSLDLRETVSQGA